MSLLCKGFPILNWTSVGRKGREVRSAYIRKDETWWNECHASTRLSGDPWKPLRKDLEEPYNMNMERLWNLWWTHTTVEGGRIDTLKLVQWIRKTRTKDRVVVLQFLMSRGSIVRGHDRRVGKPLVSLSGWHRSIPDSLPPDFPEKPLT